MQSDLTSAIYKPSALPECAGNPLIEALPPFWMSDDLIEAFGRGVQCKEAERAMPAAHRMMCVSRLNNFLQMMPSHSHIIEQVGLLIRSGYVHRNPVLPEYNRSLVHFYRQSMEGHIVPIETSGPSTAPSFSLFGVPGVGKSTVLERTLSFYPKALSHPQHGFLQLVWLKVDCPLDGSLKQLLLSIVAKIDATLGTNHGKYINGRTTIDKLIVDVAKISAQHHMGVLVVDEIQNLLDAPGIGPAKMLNFFVTFANEVKVPFIVSGTPKAKEFLQTLFREARRLSDHGSTTWDRMTPGPEWDGLFLKALWKHQWVRKVEKLTPELSAAMYAQTQGINALVVRLFQLVQLHAIRSKSERITVGLINKVAKDKFSMLQPALDALRSGDPRKVKEFEDFLSAGIQQLAELTNEQAQTHSIKVAGSALNKDRARLTSNLLHVSQDPKLVGTIVEKLLAKATGHESTINALAQKTSSPSIANRLLDTVQSAEKAKIDPLDALKAEGLIADLSGGDGA